MSKHWRHLSFLWYLQIFIQWRHDQSHQTTYTHRKAAVLTKSICDSRDGWSSQVLRPTRHKIGHFRHVPQANLLARYRTSKPDTTKVHIYHRRWCLTTHSLEAHGSSNDKYLLCGRPETERMELFHWIYLHCDLHKQWQLCIDVSLIVNAYCVFVTIYPTVDVHRAASSRQAENNY